MNLHESSYESLQYWGYILGIAAGYMQEKYLV